MSILIDSSVLIAGERGHLDLDTFLRKHGPDSCLISAITASELLHGVHRATPERRVIREAYIENLLQRLPVVPFDIITARIHSHIWADLARKGTPVGSLDLLIAATALARGYQLATRDERSFRRIPGLMLLIP